MQEFSDYNPGKNNHPEAGFFLPPALYVVATPIGNYQDITLRAINILKNSDYIICEDSRVTAKLLDKFSIKKPLITYNDHSEISDREKILHLIQNKKSVALVSDAGTPLISDPGYKLVAMLLENNVKVISIPGASSVTAALSISGIESDRFLFAGFIPNSTLARTKFLKEFSNINSSLIFFEAANRLDKTISAMFKIFGNRTASVVREITKIYEETKKDHLQNLAEYYSQHEIKGEVVILVSPPKSENKETDFDLIEKELKSGIGKMKPKELVALIADNHKLNKKAVYDLMMKIIKKEKK